MLSDSRLTAEPWREKRRETEPNLDANFQLLLLFFFPTLAQTAKFIYIVWTQRIQSDTLWAASTFIFSWQKLGLNGKIVQSNI